MLAVWGCDELANALDAVIIAIAKLLTNFVEIFKSSPRAPSIKTMLKGLCLDQQRTQHY